MCSSIYMKVSVGWNELFWQAWLFHFFPQKKELIKHIKKIPFTMTQIPYRRSRENVVKSKTRKKLINGFLPKLCLRYAINNLLMQNKLTFASSNFVACRGNIQLTSFFCSFSLLCQTHAFCHTLEFRCFSTNFWKRFFGQIGNLAGHYWWPTKISTTEYIHFLTFY